MESINKPDNIKIYLDNCCLNRPFDDQTQLRIELEAKAKLKIQDEIQRGNLVLVWSYILDYENSRNPFEDRKKQIYKWKQISSICLQESKDIITIASKLNKMGIKKYDALHIACAITSNCDYFLTTDDKVLKKAKLIEAVRIIDPFGFIKEIQL